MIRIQSLTSSGTACLNSARSIRLSSLIARLSISSSQKDGLHNTNYRKTLATHDGPHSAFVNFSPCMGHRP